MMFIFLFISLNLITWIHKQHSMQIKYWYTRKADILVL